MKKIEKLQLALNIISFLLLTYLFGALGYSFYSNSILFSLVAIIGGFMASVNIFLYASEFIDIRHKK